MKVFVGLVIMVMLSLNSAHAKDLGSSCKSAVSNANSNNVVDIANNIYCWRYLEGFRDSFFFSQASTEHPCSEQFLNISNYKLASAFIEKLDKTRDYGLINTYKTLKSVMSSQCVNSSP